MNEQEFVPAKTLSGHGVRLEAMTLELGEALLRETPEETFKYFLSWPKAWTEEGRRAWLGGMLSSNKTRMHAVIDERTGEIVGSSSFMDIDPANRALEIGATWYVPRARGTSVNTACKLLMLTRAFEEIGCVRVTLKCDGRNVHSQNAIAAIGATREGVLRKHRIQQNGFVRDTVYFSVIAEEWPRVREHLRARLRTRGVSA